MAPRGPLRLSQGDKIKDCLQTQPPDVASINSGPAIVGRMAVKPKLNIAIKLDLTAIVLAVILILFQHL
jgi:hypothetical protein